MDQRITIEFKNAVDLAELIKKYGHNFAEYETLQIGHDGNIYILFNRKIPERIDGMFVPTQSNSGFAVLVLQIDWDEEKITDEKYYDLGQKKMFYSFVQPIEEGFLLVSARCMNYKQGPEQNAAVVDLAGNIIEEFCLGDGISYCLVHPDLGIVTGYFDEGIIGNYGWKQPLGADGVRIWGRGARDIWRADRPIYDCYALNISDAGALWYYYYAEFKLVKVNARDFSEREFVPGIDGADSLIISEDEVTLFMDKGYDANEQFVARKVLGDRLGEEMAVEFKYNGENCKVR
nr:hypothetical protein [Lachnospiraceae bacterium]